LDSDGAIAFAHIFKREFPIPSTPLAFAIFKFFSKLITSVSHVVIFLINSVSHVILAEQQNVRLFFCVYLNLLHDRLGGIIP
jgi:hypothetical protein